MSWIALVGPEVEENLGLRYLASSLHAAGFDAEILRYDRPVHAGRVLAAIEGASEPPLLVAVSLAFQWRAVDTLGLVVALRARGYPGHVTAGGHFGTFSCREVLADFPEVDTICRNEAEETIVSLARAIETGGDLSAIPGLALRDGGGELVLTEAPARPDLATLPPPDRRGPPVVCLGHGIAPLVASRGCYGNCAFCCIAAWHAQAKGKLRWRIRPVEDVADEMASLYHDRGIEVFVFHDDDFFVPGRAKALARVEALADAVDARGLGRIATVIKARPNDVDPEVFRAMRDRLGLTRVFVGIETDTLDGLVTLRRAVKPGRNAEALRTLEGLGIYVCFNMLVFDPDARVADLETNLDFMDQHATEPHNFGRVELYAGTPLLARMQAEGRAFGDYAGWDYRLADPWIQRVYDLFLRTFVPRNFEGDEPVTRLMGTRFDVEIARRFHPDAFDPLWLESAKDLARALNADSTAAMREIIAFVQGGAPEGDEDGFVASINNRLRATEARIVEAAGALEETIQAGVGRRCRHVRPLPEAA